MPRLSPEERERALGMIDAGVSQYRVARTFNVNRCTISRLIERFNATGVTRDRPRTGQPRVTQARTYRYIVNTHLRDRFRSASETARNTIGRRGVISYHTVQRRLSEANLSCRRPYAGAILSRQRRANRVLWARQHLRWTLQQWDSVVFSDESRFCVRHMDGRRRVYRRPGERYADCCVYETDRWGGWESCCLGWDQHQPQD